MQFKLPKRLSWKKAEGYTFRQVRPELTFKQLLRTMKLTAILLLIAALQVSAKGLSQGITLRQKEVPLEKVLQEIKRQSGFSVVYTKQQVSNAQPVTIEVKNVSIQKALEETLKGQSLTYTILGNTIIIQPRAEAPAHVTDSLPTAELKGQINNAQGEPLSGANLIIKRTGRGTQTNTRGQFLLKEVFPDDIITISYTGYATKVIKPGDYKTYLIVMQMAENQLDELVIQAYGTTTRRGSTGSISRITSSELQKQPVTNVLQALEGTMPGLSITQANGLPGANPSVIIRGRNSLTGNTYPLYVIDGIPFDGRPVNQRQLDGTTTYPTAAGLLSPLSTINPSDIESVEILKDADATAIYGSRAANGVILITTKKGRSGKTTLNMNVTTGAGKVAKFVELLNTEQYLMLRREAYRNDPTVLVSPAFSPDLYWDSTVSTDWQKVLIGGTAKTTDATATFSGGDLRNHFLLSGAYHNETTVFPGNFGYKRWSAHASMEHFSPNRRFNATVSTFFTADKNNLTGVDYTGVAFSLAPNFPLYDSTGKLYWGGNTGNPLATLNNTSESKTTNLLTNLTLRYTLLPGLNIKSNVGYNRIEMTASQLSPTKGQNPAFASSVPKGLFTNNVSESFIVEPQVEYSAYISKGKFTAMAGGTWQHVINRQPYVLNVQFSSDAMMGILNGASIQSISNTTIESKFASAFGRINYNWQGKYILNGSVRRDGSSNFGDNNKYGNFGAVGAAWVFNEEPFIKDLFKWFSYGKLRGSYGSTGSDAASAYSYMATYSIFGANYGSDAAAFPSRIANPNYQWEVTRKLEGALELGFLKDRILINAAWYRNRSNNMLVQYPLSFQTGFGGYQANMPALVQNTGWEFDITTTNIKTNQITWSTSVNFTIPRNKLVSYPNFESSSYTSTYIIGEPLSFIAKYQFTGIDPLTGLPTILDANKDGKILPFFASTGKGDFVIIGSGYPEYYGGIKNSLSWKGLQLDILLQFVKQIGPNEKNLQRNTIGGAYNNYVGVLNRWQKPGDVTDVPRAGLTGNYSTFFSYYGVSSAMYSDASFVRLKNVSLSYTLPRNWVKKMKIDNFQLFVRGQNLYTITRYKGYDPETSGAVTPLLRTIYAGIQCSL